MARGDLQCRLDEAALEIVRWRLRIATSGEHIKLRHRLPGSWRREQIRHRTNPRWRTCAASSQQSLSSSISHQPSRFIAGGFLFHADLTVL